MPVVLKLCLAFNLNYLNSISLLNALGYGLNPQLIFNGNDYFQNDDYYITYFLSTYQKINDEELKNMKKLFPDNLHYLFLI